MLVWCALCLAALALAADLALGLTLLVIVGGLSLLERAGRGWAMHRRDRSAMPPSASRPDRSDSPAGCVCRRHPRT